jgi:hypothetical protein
MSDSAVCLLKSGTLSLPFVLSVTHVCNGLFDFVPYDTDTHEIKLIVHLIKYLKGREWFGRSGDCIKMAFIASEECFMVPHTGVLDCKRERH